MVIQNLKFRKRFILASEPRLFRSKNKPQSLHLPQGRYRTNLSKTFFSIKFVPCCNEIHVVALVFPVHGNDNQVVVTRFFLFCIIPFHLTTPESFKRSSIKPCALLSISFSLRNIADLRRVIVSADSAN